MAHTPGPWQAMPEHGRIVLNGSAIYGVADITGDYASWNSDDLRLMAAAPELLAALKAIRDDLLTLDSGDVGNGVDGWRHMDATLVDQLISGSFRVACDAIAKAEGRAE